MLRETDSLRRFALLEAIQLLLQLVEEVLPVHHLMAHVSCDPVSALSPQVLWQPAFLAPNTAAPLSNRVALHFVVYRRLACTRCSLGSQVPYAWLKGTYRRCSLGTLAINQLLEISRRI